MRFSLVVPCYNEESSLPELLERLALVAVQPGVEVILVDNGSTDESHTLLLDAIGHNPDFRVVTLEDNRGYGHGVLTGLKSALGEIVGWTHADLQTDPADVLRGLEFFDSQGEGIFVKGRRFGRPAADVVFSAGMSVFETILLRQPLWDINAQPTMFSRKFFESWREPPTDFSLDLYAYWKAKSESLPVYRFPVEFRVRKYGVSHWNTSEAARWKFIKRTLSFSFELKKRRPR